MERRLLRKIYSEREIEELIRGIEYILEVFEEKVQKKLTAFLQLCFVIEIIVSVIVLIYGQINMIICEEMLEEKITIVKLEAMDIPENLYNVQYENVEFDQKIAVIETANYVPTEVERQMAYLVAFGEAGIEDSLGQTLVINVAINNMRKDGYDNLISEFNAKNRYSSVVDGKVFIGKDKEYQVTEKDITEELKAAVDRAFEKDYSEELLKAEAMANGLTDTKYYEGGACYFYNPSIISEEQTRIRENIEVKFQHGNHVFYRFWDK